MRDKGLDVTRVKNPSDADSATDPPLADALHSPLADSSVFEALGTPENEN